MVKIGDIVCWKPKTVGKVFDLNRGEFVDTAIYTKEFDLDRGEFVDTAIYMVIEQIMNPPGTTGNYLFGRGYDFKTGKTTGEVYDFWEEDVTIVDMKGAYI